MSNRKSKGMSTGNKMVAIGLIVMLGVGVAFVASGGTFFGLFPGLEPAGKQVIVSVYVYEEGGAHAVVASIAVFMFDEDMNFIETATTAATGLATFSEMQPEGSTLYFQARQAAPLTADPYLGSVETRIVPVSGEAGDTITVKSILVWDATETPPTFNVTALDGRGIYTSTNFINDTDTGFNILYSAIDADTAYGLPSRTVDYTSDAQRQWTTPIFVWRGTAPQTWDTDPTWTISSPTYIYYIWEMPQLVDSTASTTDDLNMFTIHAGATLALDSDIILDIYDSIMLDGNGQATIGALVDAAGGAATTAVDTTVE